MIKIIVHIPDTSDSGISKAFTWNLLYPIKFRYYVKTRDKRFIKKIISKNCKRFRNYIKIDNENLSYGHTYRYALLHLKQKYNKENSTI